MTELLGRGDVALVAALVGTGGAVFYTWNVEKNLKRETGEIITHMGVLSEEIKNVDTKLIRDLGTLVRRNEALAKRVEVLEHEVDSIYNFLYASFQLKGDPKSEVRPLVEDED